MCARVGVKIYKRLLKNTTFHGCVCKRRCVSECECV